MKYLVMECHKGYAIVLSEDGRFIKTANLNYQPGQRIDTIVECCPILPAPKPKFKPANWIAAAACFVFLCIGAGQLYLSPVGYVNMRINPDVRLAVNRFDKVTEMEGQNADGVELIKGMSCFGKPVERMSSELAQRAAELGYLKEDGTINIIVDSDDEKWMSKVEDRIITELVINVGENVTIVTQQKKEKQDQDIEIIIPVTPSENKQTSHVNIEDDDEDDDDDDVKKTVKKPSAVKNDDDDEDGDDDSNSNDDDSDETGNRDDDDDDADDTASSDDDSADDAGDDDLSDDDN